MYFLCFGDIGYIRDRTNWRVLENSQNEGFVIFEAQRVSCGITFFFVLPYRSFAYLTIRDRLPVILTKVIDLVHRRASAFLEENQQVENYM